MLLQFDETIVSQERTGSWSVRDIDDGLHLLEWSTDSILLDAQPYAIEATEKGEVRFVGHAGTITCSQVALWEAFAGEAAPTAEEAGRLIAENLMLWERTRQWRLVFQSIRDLVQSPIDSALLRPTLPRPRLDPFTEEVLARCDDEVTPALARAVATLLRRDTSTVLGWLQQRGKRIIWFPPAEPTPLLEAEVQKSDQPEVDAIPAPVQASSKEQKPREKHPWGYKSQQKKKEASSASISSGEDAQPPAPLPLAFRWSKDRLRDLDNAFYALSEEIRKEASAAAQIISEQTHWPSENIVAKIQQLQMDQPGRVLRTGAYVWTANVEGDRQSWGLDYPYGSFPMDIGELIRYRGQVYLLLHSYTNQIAVQEVTVGEVVSEGDMPAKQSMAVCQIVTGELVSEKHCAEEGNPDDNND